MPRPASSSASPRTETPVPSASRMSASVASCARACAPPAGGDEALAQRRGVDAPAVVGDLEDEEVAVLARADRDRRGLRLAAGGALLRRLDAVRDRVAEQLRDRIDELLGDRLVELGLLAERAELDVHAGRAAQGAQRASRVGHQVLRALHADAHEAALELADRAAQRLDLVEQRRGGLREQRGLARELALGLAERRRAATRRRCRARSRRAGSGACARGRARACAAAGRGARCACDRTGARLRSTSARRCARARRAGRTWARARRRRSTARRARARAGPRRRRAR